MQTATHIRYVYPARREAISVVRAFVTGGYCPRPGIALGTDLEGAQLNGASLKRVLVWRSDARGIRKSDFRGTIVELDRNDPCQDKSSGLCALNSYAGIKKLLEREVPETHIRRPILENLSVIFDADQIENESEMTSKWNELESESAPLDVHEQQLAEQFAEVGCSEASGPYVIDSLIADIASAFVPKSPRKRELAAAILSPSCAGARGISSDSRGKLIEMRDGP